MTSEPYKNVNREREYIPHGPMEEKINNNSSEETDYYEKKRSKILRRFIFVISKS